MKKTKHDKTYKSTKESTSEDLPFAIKPGRSRHTNVCKAAVPWKEQNANEICTKIFNILSCQNVTESDNESEWWEMRNQVTVLRYDM